jgi:hypothetical protein
MKKVAILILCLLPATSFAAPLAATANGKRFGFRLGVNGHIGPAAVQVQEYMLKAS